MAAAAILKIALFGHNSSLISRFSDFSEILRYRKQNGMPTKATRQTGNFKNQHGWRPLFWKSLNRHISVKNRQILMKFGTLQQILNQMTVRWTKIEILKTKDGGGRHLENRFFGLNSSTDCLISAKVCMRKHNGMPTKVMWQNYKFLPRDASIKRGLCRHAVSVCVSVCHDREFCQNE